MTFLAISSPYTLFVQAAEEDRSAPAAKTMREADGGARLRPGAPT